MTETAEERTVKDQLRGFLRPSTILALRQGVHFEDGDTVDDEDDQGGDVLGTVSCWVDAVAPAPQAVTYVLTPSQEAAALQVCLDHFVPLLCWPPSRLPDLQNACPSLFKAAIAVGSRSTANEVSSSALYRKALEAATTAATQAPSLAVCLALQLLVTWPVPRTTASVDMSAMAIASASALGLDLSFDDADRQVVRARRLCWLVDADSDCSGSASTSRTRCVQTRSPRPALTLT